MFGTPKPTASLSSGLLARKGHARPAMRPQGYVSLTPGLEDLGWNDMGGDETAAAPQPVPAPPVAARPVPLTAPEVPLEAPEPPVLRQRAVLDESFANEAPAKPLELTVPLPVVDPAPEPAAPVVRAKAPAPRTLARVAREVHAKKSKAAFTLRLDSDRHLRLRLASAVRNQSAQQLVTEALDAFLDSLTDVDALARQIDAREGRD